MLTANRVMIAEAVERGSGSARRGNAFGDERPWRQVLAVSINGTES